MTDAEIREIQQLVDEHGQQHLLQFWDELDEKQRAQLVGACFRSINEFFHVEFLRAQLIVGSSGTGFETRGSCSFL